MGCMCVGEGDGWERVYGVCVRGVVFVRGVVMCEGEDEEM